MGVATAIAIAGVAVSAYSAVESGKNADKAREQQKGASERRAQSAQNQLDFGKKQYADWKDMFYPVMGDLKTMAYETDRPDYTALQENVGNAFDTSQAINERNMERYGIKPTDGAFQASNTQYGLGRALATSGAFNAARRSAKNQKWNRLMGFEAIGNNMQSTANRSMNRGYGALQNAYGNQANMYGRKAGRYADAAAQGARAVGRGASYVAANWGDRGSSLPPASTGFNGVTGAGTYTGPGSTAVGWPGMNGGGL